MKKQYLAEIVHRQDEHKERKWENAIHYTNAPIGRRYFKTLEEAKEAIRIAIAKNKPKGKDYVDTIYSGMIGISNVVTTETQNKREIVASRILCREVTDWEQVEL